MADDIYAVTTWTCDDDFSLRLFHTLADAMASVEGARWRLVGNNWETEPDDSGCWHAIEKTQMRAGNA